MIAESNIEKTNNKEEKKVEISNKVGYLTQLKREKEKEIKKLEEKEFKPRRPSKTKIVITSKDKKKNNYDNPSEIKMGRIYTTLNQNPKKIKSKAKSVQKGRLKKENGYYYCLSNDHEYNSVLRFYKESNKVIGASIGSTSSEIKFIGLFPKGNWFNENYENSGNYEISISGNKIAFSLGKVHYKGTLLNRQKMELFVHSDINGNEDTKVYKFISLDVLQDIRDLDLNDN